MIPSRGAPPPRALLFNWTVFYTQPAQRGEASGLRQMLVESQPTAALAATWAVRELGPNKVQTNQVVAVIRADQQMQISQRLYEVKIKQPWTTHPFQKKGPQE